MRVLAGFLLGLAACGGGPILQNVPRPNPVAVAGIAAVAATAATVANPAAAGRPQETKRPLAEEKPVETKEHVPLEVLDRLDAEDSAGDEDAPPPPPSR